MPDKTPSIESEDISLASNNMSDNPEPNIFFPTIFRYRTDQVESSNEDDMFFVPLHIIQGEPQIKHCYDVYLTHLICRNASQSILHMLVGRQKYS